MSANDVYGMAVKMNRLQVEPAFESLDDLRASWSRQWGCNNRVGQLRAVTMHRPGHEFDVIDTTKDHDDIEVIERPCEHMHPNGGGIHCRSGPLVRDSID